MQPAQHWRVDAGHALSVPCEAVLRAGRRAKGFLAETIPGSNAARTIPAIRKQTLTICCSHNGE
jgi:hypothetical protein